MYLATLNAKDNYDNYYDIMTAGHNIYSILQYQPWTLHSAQIKRFMGFYFFLSEYIRITLNYL